MLVRCLARSCRSGAWFVVALAAAGAACGDLILEMLADRGAFGAGRYTDGSNADIIPVALVGLLLLARVAYVRVRERLRRDGFFAARVSSRPVCLARRLPAIFAAQIALLWVMETSEQYMVFGHGFGPLTWLGGPVAISLAVHAAVALTILLTARALIRACEPRVIRFMRALCARLGIGCGPIAAAAPARDVTLDAAMTFVASIVHKRAPPPALRFA